MSDTLRNIFNELKQHSDGPWFSLEFEDLPTLLDIEWREFMLRVHPNRCRYFGGDGDFESYSFDYDYLQIEKSVYEAYENILRNSVVNVVKKFEHNIFALTISPSPRIENIHDEFKNVVSQIVNSVNVVNYLAVQELSTENKNLHYHILLEYAKKDRNSIQNVKKKLNQKNKPIMKCTFKIDKMKSKIHLLKTVRYLKKDLGKSDSFPHQGNLEYFREISGD